MVGLGQNFGQRQTQTVGAATVFEARLLQAAGPELDAIIAAALTDNPFLSVEDTIRDADADAAAVEAEPSALDWLDAPREDADPDWGAVEASLVRSDEPQGLDGFAAPEDGGVRAHLEKQLALARLRPWELSIARRLIAEVDDAGYLMTGLDEIARGLGVSASAVADVLHVLRGFEPSGAFARDLRECLAFQASDQGVLDAAMKATLFRLELVAEGRPGEIAARSGLPLTEIEASVARLKGFDPRPGLRFAAPAEPPGPPEIIVAKAGDGRWRARLNPEAFPELLLDRESRDRVLAAVRSQEERRFVNERWRDARSLKRALARRGATLLRVGGFLAERQAAFFDRGPSALAPLRQSDAAQALALDPSTVSRAVSGKRLRCPRGLFDLAALFPGAVSHDTDSSSEAVKTRIRSLIDAENPAAPLSDDAIAERLKFDGLGVARRTVAKYREAMGLAPARRRRRLKAD